MYLVRWQERTLVVGMEKVVGKEQVVCSGDTIPISIVITKLMVVQPKGHRVEREEEN